MEKDLKLLMRRNVDGHKGYELASENIENNNFKNFLESYARQRSLFADEIEAILEDMDAEVEQKTSMLGDVHQAFVKLKESVSDNDDETILKECARGESLALSDYEKVLKGNKMTAEIQKTLMKHRDKIRAAEGTMRELGAVVAK